MTETPTPTPDQPEYDPTAPEPDVAEPTPEPPAEPTPDHAPTPEPQTEPTEAPEQEPADQPEPEAEPPGPEITGVNPPEVLAGQADQVVEIRGEHLQATQEWKLDDQPALVDVHSSTRATLTLPTASLSYDDEESFVVSADGSQAEITVKPFLSEGEPVKDTLFGQEVEANPNPLRIPSQPPVV
jgi:hypothetical protein